MQTQATTPPGLRTTALHSAILLALAGGWNAAALADSCWSAPQSAAYRSGSDGYAGTRDVSINNQNSQWNGGNGTTSIDGTTVRIGFDGGNTFESRGLLRFEGLSLPAGAQLVSATLTATFNNWNPGIQIQGHYLNAPWDPSAATEVTWKRRDGDAQIWTAPGASGEGSDRIAGQAFALPSLAGTGSDVASVELDPAIVQGWIDDPAGNQGVLLSIAAAGKSTHLYASEHATQNLRPRLVLTYVLPEACPAPQEGGGSTGGGGQTGNGDTGPVAYTPAGTLPVDCSHQGSGRDIQVGNPLAQSGNGILQVAHLGDVDWNNLQAGDTVRIFWREQPYREKILIRGQGTAQQPIRVCGVPGPNGELPHISGDNATTRADLAFGDVADNWMEDLGVVTLYNNSYGQRPEHVIVEGLKITDTYGGNARTGEELSYQTSAASGSATRPYRYGAACLRVQHGDHITVRGNEIARCGNGLFMVSNVPENRMLRNVLIEGNHLHDNGSPDREGIHQAYLQGVNFTLQYNHFGELRHGADGSRAAGNNLKMRVAGDIVRYNLFENGTRMLDLIEVEDHADMILPWRYEAFRTGPNAANLSPERLAAMDAQQALDWAAYGATYVYGNVLHNFGPRAGANLIHYGFDMTQSDRRRGHLYFYDNTVIHRTDQASRGTVRLLDQGPYWGDSGEYPAILDHTYEGYATLHAVNNLIVQRPYSAGSTASGFEFTRYLADKLDLGANWISNGWNSVGNGVTDDDPATPPNLPGFGNDAGSQVYAGGNDGHHVTGTENLITGGGNPLNFGTGSCFLAEGSFAGIGSAPLPAEIPANLLPTRQLQLVPAGADGTCRDGVRIAGLADRPGTLTLGAFEDLNGSGDNGTDTVPAGSAGSGSGTTGGGTAPSDNGSDGPVQYTALGLAAEAALPFAGRTSGADHEYGCNGSSNLIANAAYRYVDAAASGGDGSRLAPFASIQAAFDSFSAAEKNRVLCVAGGHYPEHVGSNADRYASGETYTFVGGFQPGSDYAVRHAIDYPSVVTAPNQELCQFNGSAADCGVFTFGNVQAITLDGFEITGGRHGIHAAGYSAGREFNLYNSHVHHNGIAATMQRGGGVLAGGSTVRIKHNLIEQNQSGHNGGGLFLGTSEPRNHGQRDADGRYYLSLTTTSALAEIHRNIVQDNRLTHDTPHGVGMAIGMNADVAENIVRRNVGYKAGSGGDAVGGGLIVQSPVDHPAVANIHDNWFEANVAKKYASAVFIDESSIAAVYNNVAVGNEGVNTIGLDGAGNGSVAGYLTAYDNTVVSNYGAAFGVEDGILHLLNNISWNNGGDDLHIAPGYAATPETVWADYNRFANAAGFAPAMLGGHNLVGVNPGFANSQAGDFALAAGSALVHAGLWDIGGQFAFDAYTPGSPMVAWQASVGAGEGMVQLGALQ